MPDEEKGTEQPEQTPGILYGRKWEILIYKPAYKKEGDQNVRDPEHDIAMDVSALRCIFKCQYNIESPAATLGTLIVYNMNIKTEKAVIEEGFQIQVSGGYETGQYGVLYVGDIIQVIRNRENGTDYRLEILALRGTFDFDRNHIRATIAANSKPREQAKAVCEQADKKIKVGKIDEGISEQGLPRGKVLFGSPGKYLRNICLYNNAWFEKSNNETMNLHYLNAEIPETDVLTLTPTSGLVGTPKYTDGGIQIKMLLEPRLKLYSLIKIDNELIQRQLINISNGEKGVNVQGTPNQNTQFDEDGEYTVASISHSMDTWGDDWTTDVLGVGRNGRMGLASQASSPEQSLKA